MSNDPRTTEFEQSPDWQIAAHNWVDTEEGRAAFAATTAYDAARDTWDRADRTMPGGSETARRIIEGLADI